MPEIGFRVLKMFECIYGKEKGLESIVTCGNRNAFGSEEVLT